MEHYELFLDGKFYCSCDINEVDDEINPADKQLKKYTLNLDSNYSSKNSVNIFIDSWT